MEYFSITLTNFVSIPMYITLTISIFTSYIYSKLIY